MLVVQLALVHKIWAPTLFVQLPCRCALCNCITQVAQSSAAFASPQRTQPAKPVQTVIVQHPDDEQGNQQIAVGVANG